MRASGSLSQARRRPGQGTAHRPSELIHQAGAERVNKCHRRPLTQQALDKLAHQHRSQSASWVPGPRQVPWSHSRTYLIFIFLFLFLAIPSGLWDLSSPTRDGTRAPCSGSAEF